MKQKTLLLLAAAVGSLGLVGCSELPPLDFSLPDVEISDRRHDAEVKSIVVSFANEDEQEGDVDVVVIESAGVNITSGTATASLWESSLEEALTRSLIFQDDASNKISIFVKVLKLDVPAFGFSFTTDAIARYEIVNRASGEIIFNQKITSIGEVPADYAFAGVIRARESVNRSVRNNIRLFLEAIKTADLVE
ncbi:MAG: UDP-N-acetylglucosamine acyltransferase [Gammaproteobacteria bacterium]|nr:UDP-N-acetylglucosamine acyltransferase [Gammaproteobacteria bacterium]